MGGYINNGHMCVSFNSPLLLLLIVWKRGISLVVASSEVELKASFGPHEEIMKKMSHSEFKCQL